MTALASQLLQQLAELGGRVDVPHGSAVTSASAFGSLLPSSSCWDAASQVSQAITSVRSATTQHCTTVQEAQDELQAGLQQLLQTTSQAQGPCTSRSSALQQLLRLVVEGSLPAGPQHGAPAAAGHTPAIGAASTTSCFMQGLGCWPDVRGLQRLDPQQRLLAAQEVLTQLDDMALGALPGGALGHALLLEPSLLPRLLSLMASTAAAGAASGHAGSQDQAAAGTARSSCSSSGRVAMCEAPWTAVSSRFPGVRHLPTVLTQQPYLLLLARSTLHSWLVSSNHPSVALLLTQLCRPAWQQLLDAGPHAGTPPPGSTAAAAAEVTAVDATPTGIPLPMAECVHPAVAAVCPVGLLPLLQLLVTSPTPEGLERLVGLLQQLAVLEPLNTQQQAAGAPAVGSADAGQNMYHTGAGGVPAAAAAGAAAEGTEVVPNPWDMPWPSDMDWEGGPTHRHGGPTLAAATFHPPAGPAASNGCAAGAACAAAGGCWSAASRRLVEGAWQLLQEHRCWYDHALWLLVHTALSAAAEGAPSGAQELDGSTPSATTAGDGVPAAAQQAALVVAWVQEPHDMARRQQLFKDLLAPFHTSPSGTTQSGANTSSSNSSGMPSADLLQRCCWLCGAWTVSLQQQLWTVSLQQQQQQQREGPGGIPSSGQTAAAYCPTTTSSSSRGMHWWLVMVELPCAMLQQQEVLLAVPAEDLLHQLLAPQLSLAEGGAPPASCAVHCAQQQQQQQEQEQAVPCVQPVGNRRYSCPADGHGCGAEDAAAARDQLACPTSAAAAGSQPRDHQKKQQQQQEQPTCMARRWVMQQLLQCCELLSAAAVGYLQAQLMPTILSTSREGQPGPQQLHWLAQCWAASPGAGSGGQGGSRSRFSSQTPGLAVGKRLVMAATSLDQQLKAFARQGQLQLSACAGR